MHSLLELGRRCSAASVGWAIRISFIRLYFIFILLFDFNSFAFRFALKRHISRANVSARASERASCMFCTAKLIHFSSGAQHIRVILSLFCPFSSNRNRMHARALADLVREKESERSQRPQFTYIIFFFCLLQNNNNEIFILIKFLFPLCSFSFAPAFLKQSSTSSSSLPSSQPLSESTFTKLIGFICKFAFCCEAISILARLISDWSDNTQRLIACFSFFSLVTQVISTGTQQRW